MTILRNTYYVEFDPDEALEAPDRAQPVCVDPSDEFVTITQQDGDGGCLHVILVERRDVQALIEALLRS